MQLQPALHSSRIQFVFNPVNLFRYIFQCFISFERKTALKQYFTFVKMPVDIVYGHPVFLFSGSKYRPVYMVSVHAFATVSW